ncbi:MAG: AAA family ATPase [Gammaproteobacteria bacterium]
MTDATFCDAEDLAAATDAKRVGDGWTTRCPAHDDNKPSLTIGRGRDGLALVNCKAGCSQRDVLEAFRAQGLELTRKRTDDDTAGGCTLDQYARAKRLPAAWLGELGLSDTRYQSTPAVRMDYRDSGGTVACTRYRIAVSGKNTMRTKKGHRAMLYGLDRLPDADHVVLVEGESDCHTLWHHGIGAVGVQGAANWRDDRDAAYLERYVTIYAVREPDTGGDKLTERLATSRLRDRIHVVTLGEFKDPSALHLDDPAAFVERFGEFMDRAEPMAEVKPRRASPNPKANGAALAQPLVVDDAATFLALDLPPRHNVLEPWLPAQGLAEIFAFRGTGKTYVSLGIAVAMASGGEFLRWRAPEPVGVLFVDGEMPANYLQKRLDIAVKMSGAEQRAPLRVITPDRQAFGVPDLSTEAGQAVLDKAITDDIRVVILDNLTTLMRTGKENEAESWQVMQTWVLRWRAAGRSIVFVHHAGRAGHARGTTRREDVLDTVIKLARPSDYEPDQGARFEVHFNKSRGIHGDDVKPFEAMLSDGEYGAPVWTMKSLEQTTRERVGRLLDDGLKQKDIAIELGLKASTVSYHAKQIEAALAAARAAYGRRSNGS